MVACCNCVREGPGRTGQREGPGRLTAVPDGRASSVFSCPSLVVRSWRSRSNCNSGMLSCACALDHVPLSSLADRVAFR